MLGVASGLAAVSIVSMNITLAKRELYPLAITIGLVAAAGSLACVILAIRSRFASAALRLAFVAPPTLLLAWTVLDAIRRLSTNR